MPSPGAGRWACLLIQSRQGFGEGEGVFCCHPLQSWGQRGTSRGGAGVEEGCSECQGGLSWARQSCLQSWCPQEWDGWEREPEHGLQVADPPHGGTRCAPAHGARGCQRWAASHAHFLPGNGSVPRPAGEGQDSHLRTGRIMFLMGLSTYLTPVPNLPAGHRCGCHGGRWWKQSLLLLQLFLLPERCRGGGGLG